MANNNANQNIEIDEIDTDFDFEEVECFLSKQLEESFSNLELLERDRENISNPDSLGKIVLDEVWKQFGNQIGLDMTNETLIQKYDREHPEQYKEIADSVMQDQRYKDANKAMKEQQQAGNLKDEYTGKDLKPGEKANLDHVVPRKELYENQRRKQANLSVADVANKEENLKPTNESLNKSKKEKSNKEYIETRETREKILIEQNEKANKKVDESNKSDVEKRLQKEENDKRLNDKLAADDDLMMQADKEARKAINKDIQVNAAKEVGKKAGKDALKTMAITALFSLLKEIMNGLIRFLKEKSKSFKGFLSEMKESIKSFFSKILSVVQTGASTLIGTIISEIFGPIVSLFKKLASLIKQGISSVIDAVNYLRDKKNKDKPFTVKVAQVGKIITVGLVGGSAIFLGEVFEKFLLTVPGMQIEIPLIGTLANMIGLFLSSLVSGLIGAIVLNLIDKFIAKKLKEVSDLNIIHKKNEIMNLQQVQLYVAENHLLKSKENAMGEISENHKLAKDLMQQSLNKIFDKDMANEPKNTDSSNKSDLGTNATRFRRLTLRWMKMSNIKIEDQSIHTGKLIPKDFNEYKNKIKAFSQNLPKEIDLPIVPSSGGLFGWFDYKVTGNDLNSLTESIQNKMIQQNKFLVKTIQEFNTIYNTFSALDKEYIQGILISLKAAEEANLKALKGIEGVQENQKDIKQIINQQKQVIEILKNFKEKIEKIEHLADVDKIFDVFSTIQSNFKAIEAKGEAQELIVADLTKEMKALLSSQSVFRDNLNHLKEIQVNQFQTVEQLVSNQNESISNIKAISAESKTNIEALNKEISIHGEKLGDLKRLIHDDIQTLSEKVTRNNSEFDAKLDSTTNEVTKNKINFENAIKELKVGIEQQEESMSAYLESELSMAKNEIRELSLSIGNLSKVLKTTKVISFASIAITCILVILIISGVL